MAPAFDIEISDAARNYFERLIEQQATPGTGIAIRVAHAGTPAAECRLEFSEPADRDGSEVVVPCGTFSVHVERASQKYLDGARIDVTTDRAGVELTIHAPALRGSAPGADASVEQRVRWVIDSEINPKLATHHGRVGLVEFTAEGVAVLEFGGGCHGCGMADVTLKRGVEATLRERIPELRGVADATDHASGRTPYYRRGSAG